MSRIRTKKSVFDHLNPLVTRFEAAGRDPSIALLIWFLQLIYRLDEVEAIDAVVDGKGDMGVDGCVVNDNDREIVI